MKKFDLLVAGEINPDLILTGPNLEPQFGQREILIEDISLTAGSSSVIFACGAARLGLRVAFIGIIGDDLFGAFMLDVLKSRNVDVSNVIVDKNQFTGLSVILNRIDDRAILTHMGAINALYSEQITNELLAKARHLHVASYFLQTNLQAGMPELFKRAIALGLTTSLDTNWDPEEKWVGVDELLKHTTVFLPNEAEALSLTGAPTVVEAAGRLATQASIVAVKMGLDGNLAFDGESLYRAPIIPVDVVDTVGAGDTFDAGFIFGFLQGWSLERCLKLGIVCGSLSTRMAGGITSQPVLDKALRFLDERS
ncbi:MAG TPA: carbohydrate kinase family protein [Anaerolineales bacterium]|nr:carbohydrate kinase family protein [Anaerolineales bacterium]